MSFKNIFPWVCMLVFAVGLGLLAASNHKKEAELVVLRAQSQELEQVRDELEQIKTSNREAQNMEILRLRKASGELPHLREEIRKLQNENQKLSQQLTSWQSAAQQQPTPDMQQLQAENQQLRAAFDEAAQKKMLNSCINNLRQIDAAKQQWALEYHKSANDVPTPEDIAPYIKDNAVPKCPAGGDYIIGAINTDPTCSIPGHALPQ